MPPPGRSTRRTATTDADVLKHCLFTYLGEDIATIDNCDTMKALKHAGVKGFYDDFIYMSEDDIRSLRIPPQGTTPETPLPAMICRKLIIVLSLYNKASLKHGYSVDMTKITKDIWDSYRTGPEFNPNEKIVPWVYQANVGNSESLAEWQKKVKPNKSDYPKLSEDTFYLEWKRKFKNTAKAHGLDHLLDDGYAVTNPSLYEAQSTWMFSVMEAGLKTTRTSSIIQEHQEDKDIPAIWKELIDKMENSVYGQGNRRRLLAYLTTERMSNGYKGSKMQAIKTWKRVYNIYQEVAPRRVDDETACDYLAAYIGQDSQLGDVLANAQTAAYAAGHHLVLTLDDYISLLTDRLERSHNADSKNLRGFSVNAHELLLDDEDDTDEERVKTRTQGRYLKDEDPIDTLLVNRHDRSTPSTKKIDTRVDPSSWKRLTPEDRKGWISLSDEGKKTIVGSLMSKKTGNKLEYDVNNHVLLFDEVEDPKDILTVNLHDYTPKVVTPDNKISINKTSMADSSSTPNSEQHDLLSLATKKSSKKKVGSNRNGLDINMMLSTMDKSSPTQNTKNPSSSIQITNHEFIQSRPDTTPGLGRLEINMHSMTSPGKKNTNKKEPGDTLPAGLNQPKKKATIKEEPQDTGKKLSVDIEKGELTTKQGDDEETTFSLSRGTKPREALKQATRHIAENINDDLPEDDGEELDSDFSNDGEEEPDDKWRLAPKSDVGKLEEELLEDLSKYESHVDQRKKELIAEGHSEEIVHSVWNDQEQLRKTWQQDDDGNTGMNHDDEDNTSTKQEEGKIESTQNQTKRPASSSGLEQKPRSKNAFATFQSAMNEEYDGLFSYGAIKKVETKTSAKKTSSSMAHPKSRITKVQRSRPTETVNKPVYNPWANANITPWSSNPQEQSEVDPIDVKHAYVQEQDKQVYNPFPNMVPYDKGDKKTTQYMSYPFERVPKPTKTHQDIKIDSLFAQTAFKQYNRDDISVDSSTSQQESETDDQKDPRFLKHDHSNEDALSDDELERRYEQIGQTHDDKPAHELTSEERKQRGIELLGVDNLDGDTMMNQSFRGTQSTDQTGNLMKGALQQRSEDPEDSSNNPSDQSSAITEDSTMYSPTTNKKSRKKNRKKKRSSHSSVRSSSISPLSVPEIERTTYTQNRFSPLEEEDGGKDVDGNISNTAKGNSHKEESTDHEDPSGQDF